MVPDSCFLEVKSFFNFHSLNRYSEPRILSMLLILKIFDVEG